jgi:hypothetical protein
MIRSTRIHLTSRTLLQTLPLFPHQQSIKRAQRLVTHRRSNQAQQLLLFWPIATGNKKRSDLNVSGLTA